MGTVNLTAGSYVSYQTSWNLERQTAKLGGTEYITWATKKSKKEGGEHLGTLNHGAS